MATITANGKKVFTAVKGNKRYVLCSNGTILLARYNNEGFKKVNTLKSMNLSTFGDFANMLNGLEYIVTWDGFNPKDIPRPKIRRKW